MKCVPLLAKSQELVTEALDVLRQQLPFPILGIDYDNDSAFINDTLFDYCEAHCIEFTRSRTYRKNDQAWVEQKNGAVIRRFTGHDRYAGVLAGQVMAYLYQAVRLYVNYFQPSFKLREKVNSTRKCNFGNWSKRRAAVASVVSLRPVNQRSTDEHLHLSSPEKNDTRSTR